MSKLHDIDRKLLIFMSTTEKPSMNINEQYVLNVPRLSRAYIQFKDTSEFKLDLGVGNSEVTWTKWVGTCEMDKLLQYIKRFGGNCVLTYTNDYRLIFYDSAKNEVFRCDEAPRSYQWY